MKHSFFVAFHRGFKVHRQSGFRLDCLCLNVHYLNIVRFFMMESLSNLNRFIQDYDLRQTNGTVRFYAFILFYMNGNRTTKYSEIHIITSDKLSAVYFLNAEIGDAGLPDVFDLKKHRAIYSTGECLRLEKDKVQVSIYPHSD